MWIGPDGATLDARFDWDLPDPENYTLEAFEDINGNGIHDQSDPVLPGGLFTFGPHTHPGWQCWFAQPVHRDGARHPATALAVYRLGDRWDEFAHEQTGVLVRVADPAVHPVTLFPFPVRAWRVSDVPTGLWSRWWVVETAPAAVDSTVAYLEEHPNVHAVSADVSAAGIGQPVSFRVLGTQDLPDQQNPDLECDVRADDRTGCERIHFLEQNRVGLADGHDTYARLADRLGWKGPLPDVDFASTVVVGFRMWPCGPRLDDRLQGLRALDHEAAINVADCSARWIGNGGAPPDELEVALLGVPTQQLDQALDHVTLALPRSVETTAALDGASLPRTGRPLHVHLGAISLLLIGSALRTFRGPGPARSS